MTRSYVPSLVVSLLPLLIAGCASEIEKINADINRYPYCQDRTPAMHDIRTTGCGDCEDYAYAKCLALREQGYDVIFLYRSGTEEGHVALAVNGQTLDNQVAWPYPFKPDDWSYSHAWDCQPPSDQQGANPAAQVSQSPPTRQPGAPIQSDPSTAGSPAN